MTPQEAINFYKSFLSLIPQNSYKEAAEQSILALEKQIPKKAKVLMNRKYNKVGCCPNCNGTVVYEKSFARATKGSCCSWCGQKLDWSEKE